MSIEKEWDKTMELLRKEIERRRKKNSITRLSSKEEIAEYIVDRQDSFEGVMIVNREKSIEEMVKIIEELDLKWN